MCPYAEAGNRSLLFSGDVKVVAFADLRILTVINKSATGDIKKLLNGKNGIIFQTDEFGTVFLNGMPRKDTVFVEDPIKII